MCATVSGFCLHYFNSLSLSLSLSILLYLNVEAGSLAQTQGLENPCLCLRRVRIIVGCHAHLPWLLHGCWDLNSDFHPCAGSAEPSPQPLVSVFNTENLVFLVVLWMLLLLQPQKVNVIRSWFLHD